MAWIVFLAVLIDFSTTILGLKLGLAERGLVAARLLPVTGVAYFAVEAAVVYGLHYTLRRAGLDSQQAALAASVGPWLAGWHNLAVILRLAFGV